MLIELLKTAGPPALLVAILFYLTGRLSEPMRARAQATCLALVFAGASFLGPLGMVFPPAKAGEGFAWAALLLAVFIWINPRPVGARYLLRALFTVAVGALVLWPGLERLTGPVHLRNLLAFFFLGLGTWSILERSAQKLKAATIVLLPLLSVIGLLLLFAARDALPYSQGVGLLAGLLLAIGIVALIVPARVSGVGILPFVSVFLVAMMAAGHFQLGINPWFMIYLCIPFLILWIRPWIPRLPAAPWAEALLLLVLAVIPLIYFLRNVIKVPLLLN